MNRLRPGGQGATRRGLGEHVQEDRRHQPGAVDIVGCADQHDGAGTEQIVDVVRRRLRPEHGCRIRQHGDLGAEPAEERDALVDPAAVERAKRRGHARDRRIAELRRPIRQLGRERGVFEDS